MPKKELEWTEIANDFKILWDFDNCLGAIDGKTVLITKPANSGSYYFNYKGTFSVVIFTVANENCEFIYVLNGQMDVYQMVPFKKTDFYRSLESNDLKIPSPLCLFLGILGQK